MSHLLRSLLLSLLSFVLLVGCPTGGDDDDSVPDDDDTASDDDDATGDDDDATGDDDDSAAGDDDDATGDDDDSAVGDDDDATTAVDVDGDGADDTVDCDDNDSNNFPGNSESCDGQDNDCDSGTAFAEVALELGVGNITQPLNDFFAGNAFVVDAETTLLEIEQRLNVPAGETLQWLVFQSLAQFNGYTLVSSTSTTVSPGDAGSLQFHSSGALDIPLTAGSYYVIGVYGAVGSGATWSGQDEPSELIPVSWGTQWSGMIATGTLGTPTGADIFLGDETWYSQRLSTNGELDFDGDGVLACDGDCDDSTSLAGTGGAEVACDLVDNDCNPITIDCDGGVIVTELFNNAFGSDSDQEWIELYNTTAVAIDLEGWMIRDDDGERVFVTTPLSVPAGGYIVLAEDEDLTVNGGVPNDFEYGGAMTLGNTSDEVVLVSPLGETVDAVAYDGTFPAQEGAAMSLDPAALDASSNDAGGNWCVSFSTPYAGESTGTPQAANPTCTIPASGAVAGDLVITEILNNPLGTDGLKEWFEVYNATGSAIDLQGWEFTDNNVDGFVVTQPVVVAAGGYAVLGKSTDLSANGNAPVAFQYAGSMALGNSDDEVWAFSPEGTLIDEVSYDGGPNFPDPNGATMSLDFNTLDSISNDDGGNWCTSTAAAFGSSGDLGTPGGDNPSCGP